MTINVESTETLYATQEKTFFLKRGEAIRLTPTGSVRVNRYNLGTLLDTTTVTSETTFGAYFADMSFRIYCSSGVLTVEMGDDSGEPRATTVFPYYHFHGFAGNQTAGDGKFFDLSGINHGIRGANLSDAQMFTAAGYVSTVDPASGLTDSVIRIPSINFDYAGGEKLIVWWLGKCTAEASSQYLMGDGYSTSVHGWGIYVPTTKKLQVVLSGATQGFSGSSTAEVFDGTLHDIGVVLDGENKKYALWTDSTLDPGFSGYSTFNAGTAHDTKTTATLNIGAASPAPGGTGGIATATRSLVILRLPASYPIPSVASVTSVFKQLRANPGKLILASAL